MCTINCSDQLMIKLNAVESTFAVDFYTVVDTSRSLVHNTPCLLHWVRDASSHGRDFSLDPPPRWKFQSSFITLSQIFGPLRTPHPPGNFQSLQRGKCGYFLELHIVLTKKRFKKGLIPRVTNINFILLVHTCNQDTGLQKLIKSSLK